ncbi:MAG: AAA family ATPase [Dehalococcoidia bacterium]|nr:AAA family ATPase [Dehalococcoidia bacterium]
MTVPRVPDAPPTLPPHYESRIDWPAFWSKDHHVAEWLVEPLLPLGRSISTYSRAKAGKSLLSLDVAARIATGRRVLDHPSGAPRSVVYLDLEMTETDLFERLEDMGYGPETDLSHLHYYLLPSLPPLDTADGGAALREIAAFHDAALVIIDTTSRVLAGAENESDTLRALYRHTGQLLKADGRTVWRLDHSGKDPERGQRGTSAKNDDVDLVWELSLREGGIRLRATHRRQSWVPEFLDLVRAEEPLRHERAAESWPAGAIALASRLDALLADRGISVRSARDLLREHGEGARNDVLAAALRYRRERDEEPGNTSGNTSTGSMGNTLREQAADQEWVTAGKQRVTPVSVTGERSPSLGGEQFPDLLGDTAEFA